MNELYKNEVRGKLYRLIFKMNMSTKISVQTPVGLSGERDIGESVGQGTVDGAVISAVNLDNGVTDFFRDSEDEVNYGGISLRPLLFQDDVARLSDNIRSAQIGNDRMESVAETKLLDFNTEKSCFLVFGSKKRRLELESGMKSNPLMLCNNPMPQENSAKYLGDILSAAGLRDSVAATIEKRKPCVSRAIYETRAIVDDCRSGIVGGLDAAFQIWELAVLPMLLFNAECWQDIASNEVKILENLQFTFLRCILGVGSGCPLPMLISETGMLLMECRILKKKLLFLHHVTTLPPDSLANEILAVQKSLGLPELYTECHSFLSTHGLTNVSAFSKAQWKKTINSKIHELNKEKIISMTRDKRYKKISLSQLKEDDFKKKNYFIELNADDARLRFKFASKMTPTIAMNFQNDNGFRSKLWTCPACRSEDDIGFIDSQQHVLICPNYSKLRENKDLSSNKDLVTYIREVIKTRLN